MIRHHIIPVSEGFKILDAKLNIHVGDGKGSVLVLPTREAAEAVMGELSARLALLGTFATPEPILPALPQDPDDYQDFPALLSATSVTMRGLFG